MVSVIHIQCQLYFSLFITQWSNLVIDYQNHCYHVKSVFKWVKTFLDVILFGFEYISFVESKNNLDKRSFFVIYFALQIYVCSICNRGWVGLWGFLWWAPSAKRKDHHGVSSGWSSVWHRSNTGLSSTQYEQIPIILGVWPFWLTPFFFSVNKILAGLWLNCISSVEITLFLLADILLQHRALFQC